MMTAMPTDLMYVFRVVQMLQGLLHLLGASESARLSIITAEAMKYVWTDYKRHVYAFLFIEASMVSHPFPSSPRFAGKSTCGYFNSDCG